MKRLQVVVLAVAIAAFSAVAARAAMPAEESYRVDHGPYLQGVGYDRATVVFTTSHKGFSKVEIRRKGDAEARVCDSRKDGLIMADNTANVIAIEGCCPPPSTNTASCRPAWPISNPTR